MRISDWSSDVCSSDLCFISREPPMITRRSEAEWRGTIKDGAGTVALGSGAFSGDYSFASRFETGAGTNPEELSGAAHAGCYSLALSMVLSAAGFPPPQIGGEPCRERGWQYG